MGGRNLFRLLPEAFMGVKQIEVIGWGSQVRCLPCSSQCQLCCLSLCLDLGCPSTSMLCFSKHIALDKPNMIA